MPISDDDLNYLRNINTRPGPNAGKSIDPTKPGPSDKTDEWDREHAKSRVIIQDEKGRFEAIDRTPLPPQDVRVDANVETVAAVRRAIKEAWLVDGDKTDIDADRLASAAIAALAQSNSGTGGLKTRFEEWAFTRGHRNFTKSEGGYLLPEIQKDWLAFKAGATALPPDCPTDGVAARQGNGG